MQRFLSIYFALAFFAPLPRSLARQSHTAPAPPQQTQSSPADAAARKKRFDALKHQLESGQDSPGSSGELQDSSPMRIVYLTPYLNTNSSGRLTTESLRVDYELDDDFSQGFLEVISAGSVTARYPLRALTHGRHTVTIPRGIPLASDPVTFTCNLPRSRYSGITLRVEVIWDNRDPDSINQNFPQEPDLSIYDYAPPAPSEDRDDDPADAAAAFRGDEVAISGFNIPAQRNRLLLSTGRPAEIQIRGVNFDEGDEVVCSKSDPRAPSVQITASTRLHDVRTISTLSHAANDSIPALRAARFDLPDSIAAHGTFVRLIGTPK